MKKYSNDTLKVEMVVWNKRSQSLTVHQSPKLLLSRFILLNLQRISVRLGFDGLTGLTGWILPFKNISNNQIFSTYNKSIIIQISVFYHFHFCLKENQLFGRYMIHGRLREVVNIHLTVRDG